MLWILLILIGMYKYVATDLGINISLTKSFYTGKQHVTEHETKRRPMEHFHQQFCNEVEGLVPGEEGGLIEGWTLQGEIHELVQVFSELNLDFYF